MHTIHICAQSLRNHYSFDFKNFLFLGTLLASSYVRRSNYTSAAMSVSANVDGSELIVAGLDLGCMY